MRNYPDSLRKKARDESGMMAVTMIVSILAVLAILSVGLLFATQSDTLFSSKQKVSTKALHLAEAGVNDYLWHLNHDDDYYLTETHPAQGQDGQGNDRWVTYEDGRYHLEVTPPAEGVTVITVTSTGQINNTDAEKTIKVELRKKSFFSYLYFTDSELMEGGSTVWFIGGDIIHGPLHSNDDIHCGTGSPVFEGKVTAAKTIIYGWGSTPQFNQGYEESVEPLQLPSGNAALKDAAQSGGYYYYGATTIVFNSNGSMNITNTDSRSTGPKGVAWGPGNGVIYVDGQTRDGRYSTDGDVFVSGTLNSRITLAARDSIYVTNNLVYQNDSETSDDMLGLVADNYVYVDRNAPYDIHIDAAVLALNHCFMVENYSSPPAKGTLTVKGAIIQKFRGPVGTFRPNTGTKISGYSKNYWYDQRLSSHQPPYSLEPVNAGFEQVSWKETRR